MNVAFRIVAMAALLGLGSWMLRPREAPIPIGDLRFEESASAAGLRFVHEPCHVSEKFHNIMPWITSVGAAVAVADVDGDGLVDLYLTTSAAGKSNALFRNRGDGTFEDVTAATGTGIGNPEGASMAAVFGDIDNDGDPDLWVGMWGATNHFFENLGGLRFRDITAEAGLSFWGYANGATFVDYDRDGRLDLLVGNYYPETIRDPATGALVRNDLWNPVSTRVMHESFTHAANGGRNTLYRNVGGNRFEDVTEKVGLTFPGWTLAVGAADLDNDGWPDLYMANDFGADEIYFNTGAAENPPRFRSFVGKADRPAIGDDWWKGMNVDFGDVDDDGFLDIYVTNILAENYKTDEGNMLWINQQGRDFVNAGRKTGTHDGGWGWGAKFADFDNDGRLDILEVNGFVTGRDPEHTYWYELQEMVTQLKNATANAADWPAMGDRDLSGYEKNRLWLQQAPANGELRFVEAADALGVTDVRNGRGLATLDADNDGDVDFYIANQAAAGSYYRNELYGKTKRAGASWLALDLVGDPALAIEVNGRSTASTRDAIGARAIVTCGGRTQMREVQGGIGFAAQSDRRLYFGLDGCSTPESVELRWPSGRTERLAGASAAALVGKITRVVEGTQ